MGVLREAERVGRQRKVSVCLAGSSNTGLCFVFLHPHQSNTVSHDAPWLPNITTAAALVSKQKKRINSEQSNSSSDMDPHDSNGDELWFEEDVE